MHPNHNICLTHYSVPYVQITKVCLILTNLYKWYTMYMTKDVTFFDLFDPKQPRSDKELIESRLAICNTCPWFDKRLVKCKSCGCFMKLKTTLEKATCPKGHW